MGRPSTARARLLEAASERFHAESYGAVSVDDLCAAAGINKGSFYHFFPSKRDLALTVMDSQWAVARQTVVEPAFGADLPPLRRIRRLFELIAEAQRRPNVRGCPFGNLSGELAAADEAIRARAAGIFEAYRAYFEQALQEAMEAGDAGPLDVRAASLLLLAHLEGALLLARTYNDADVIPILGKQALAILGVQGKPKKKSRKGKKHKHG